MARVLEAVKQLTGQVKDLKSSFTDMQAQIAAIHTSAQQTTQARGRLPSAAQRVHSELDTSDVDDPQWPFDIDGAGGSTVPKSACVHWEGIPLSVPELTFFETTRAAPSLAREWRLMEARREVPFLGQYDLPEDFAVTDFRYPVAGVLMESVSDARPPTFIYANQAFCQFVGYSHDELIGRPMTICVAPNRQVLVISEGVATTTRPAAWSVSPRYRVRPIVRTRSGLYWRAYDHAYFFSDHLGSTKYGLSIVVGWEAGRLMPEESFDEQIFTVPRLRPAQPPPSPPLSPSVIVNP
jgi:hypothetical protein